MSSKWVITCEHGGNFIPPPYAPCFRNAESLLQSHRGYDPGALELYHQMVRNLADFSLFSTTSRLLVELNRSLHHQNLFSSFTKPLPAEVKQEIIQDYYLPYRQEVEEKIREFRNGNTTVVHISVHSFTPRLNGELRNADIGLLYDPGRAAEKSFCSGWKKNLQKQPGRIKIRMNYPYHGKADGFTTYLRKQFREGYIGIELELNQKHAGNPEIREGIVKSLQQLKENLS